MGGGDCPGAIRALSANIRVCDAPPLGRKNAFFLVGAFQTDSKKINYPSLGDFFFKVLEEKKSRSNKEHINKKQNKKR